MSPAPLHERTSILGSGAQLIFPRALENWVGLPASLPTLLVKEEQEIRSLKTFFFEHDWFKELK